MSEAWYRGSEFKAMRRRVLVDPQALDFSGIAVSQAILTEAPDVLKKLFDWQSCLRPSPKNDHLRARVPRLVEGRRYRRSVLPKTGAARTVDFGDGLTLRFTTDQPAARQFMRRVLPAEGLHEPELVAYLKRSIRPADLVVDIGAHVGYVSCVAAALGATVIAVEMQSTLIPMIQLNAALNNLWTVHTLCAAISNMIGMVPILRYDPSPGLKATVAQWERSDYPLTGVNHDCVPTLTLDSLFHGKDRPTLVKIDVEGAEGVVLAGARDLIQAGQTRFTVEVHAHLIGGFGTTLADLLALFDADRWTLSILTVDGPKPLSRESFLDPQGPVATDTHNAPILFEPVPT